MKRRHFMAVIGGAVASPIVARAQPHERSRRVGVLMVTSESDTNGQERLTAFRQAMAQLGWDEGRNLILEVRWTAGDPALVRKFSAELVTLAPDVILGQGTPNAAALKEATRFIPVVFAVVNDPVAIEIEGAMKRLSQQPGSALLVTPDPYTVVHRHIVIDAAAKHRVPANYSFRQQVREGALMSYGADTLDIFRRSAEYVDRILKGAKPADLPVQAPNKYELALNLKSAASLGLTVPATLLATADEVIE